MTANPSPRSEVRRSESGRRVLPPLSLAALLALSGCATFFPPDPARDPFPREKAEVEKALRGLFDAAARRDVDRLEALHLYGAKFSKFDDWPPLERQDAETSRKSERDSLESLRAFRPSVLDLKVDVFGTVAVASFVLDYELEMEKAKTRVRARATMVFVRDRGLWRVAHEHFSAYRPSAPERAGGG